jgi:iron complex outermembrane receptor protein
VPGLVHGSEAEPESFLYLTDISIEELMDTEVTSVSKKSERLHEAAAAIFVLSREDIQRSGVTTNPNALRLVPGVNVAQLDANKWAVTIRGFNSRFANKLLVLVDGRSVYTPLFGGVYWDTQDVVLEDIARIEVIRGPGSTLWGANAVNGVINIITLEAKDTQGGLLSIGGGTYENGFSTLRYGGQISPRSYYRLYSKYAERNSYKFDNGDRAADEWRLGQMGFRLDSDFGDDTHFTAQGNLYDGRLNQAYTLPLRRAPYSQTQNEGTAISGGNLLMRLRHTFSDTSDLEVQMYYDRTRRDDIYIGIEIDNVDLELRHSWKVFENHELMWGLGYRFTEHNSGNTFFASLNPVNRRDNLFSAFVQDEISLISDRLRLTLGAKFEHNDYTGFEVQPSARMAWILNDEQVIWAAVSRAVRTPSRAESDVRLNMLTLPYGIISFLGNPDLKSEELLSFELGYRVLIHPRLSLDLTAFHNRYKNLLALNLRPLELELEPWPPHFLVSLGGNNFKSAQTTGFEMALAWQLHQQGRIRAAYSVLDVNTQLKSPARSLVIDFESTNHPTQQFSLHYSLDWKEKFEFDAIMRYVSSISDIDIDEYVNVDLRFAWHLRKHLELSLVGRNLLHDQTAEFVSDFVNTVPTEVERSIYGKLTWRF